MVDLEMITLREVSQTEKDKCHITHMQNLKKKDADEIIYKIETESKT